MRGAAAFLGLLALAALAAPLLAPHGPLVQHPGSELRAPMPPYLLGTDEIGRDLLSRILHGSRATLAIALAAVAAAWAVGLPAGLIAGQRGGWVDSVITRAADALLAFPRLILGLAVLALLGPGAANIAIAIAIDLAPNVARLTRALVLRERRREYVLAARAVGVRDPHLLRRHLLPNVAGPLIAQLCVAGGYAVLAESSLSFLGLGAQPPDPSWGAMLSASRAYLREAPWYGIFPGLALAALIYSLNTVGDHLRDRLDPRRASADRAQSIQMSA
ncbi:MAG: ABC transporter permease [Chloroflexi bacterium]|nr:ABC transporter permease [Chloroflexota bacterium]